MDGWRPEKKRKNNFNVSKERKRNDNKLFLSLLPEFFFHSALLAKKKKVAFLFTSVHSSVSEWVGTPSTGRAEEMKGRNVWLFFGGWF